MRPTVLSVITRLARGGSERRLFDVLDAVDGDHVVVVGGDSDPAQVALLADRVDVVVLEPLVRSVDRAADSAALRALVATVRDRPFDVVHTHQSKAGLLGRVAARAGGVPVVYHSASMASFGPGYGRVESEVFARAERLTAPLVTRFFVVGVDLARRLAANGVPPTRLSVVRSSQRLDAFTPATPGFRAAARRGAGLRADVPVVAYVGSLETRKGVDGLVDLVVTAAAGRPVTLVVAGDGPRRAQVDAAAAAVPPEVSVAVLGHVADVPAVLHQADVLVLPSSAEGLPQVLVQAAHAGVPFVAYDVDGVAELLGAGARGASVPLGDARAFAAALAAQLDLAGTPAVRAGVPRALWAEWTPEAVADRYRAAYAADLRLVPEARRRGRPVAPSPIRP